MMFWKRDDKSKEIDELKQRLSALEESIKLLQTRSDLLQERIELLGMGTEYVRAANVRLGEAFVELIKTLKQKEEALANQPIPQLQRSHRTARSQTLGRSTTQAVAQSRMELERLQDTIVTLLKPGNKLTAKEITDQVNRTREHVSRVLKEMAIQGKISREKTGKVFVYSVKAEV